MKISGLSVVPTGIFLAALFLREVALVPSPQAEGNESVFAISGKLYQNLISKCRLMIRPLSCCGAQQRRSLILEKVKVNES